MACPVQQLLLQKLPDLESRLNDKLQKNLHPEDTSEDDPPLPVSESDSSDDKSEMTTRDDDSIGSFPGRSRSFKEKHFCDVLQKLYNCSDTAEMDSESSISEDYFSPMNLVEVDYSNPMNEQEIGNHYGKANFGYSSVNDFPGKIAKDSDDYFCQSGIFDRGKMRAFTEETEGYKQFLNFGKGECVEGRSFSKLKLKRITYHDLLRKPKRTKNKSRGRKEPKSIEKSKMEKSNDEQSYPKNPAKIVCELYGVRTVSYDPATPELPLGVKKSNLSDTSSSSMSTLSNCKSSEGTERKVDESRDFVFGAGFVPGVTSLSLSETSSSSQSSLGIQKFFHKTRTTSFGSELPIAVRETSSSD